MVAGMDFGTHKYLHALVRSLAQWIAIDSLPVAPPRFAMHITFSPSPSFDGVPSNHRLQWLTSAYYSVHPRTPSGSRHEQHANTSHHSLGNRHQASQASPASPSTHQCINTHYCTPTDPSNPHTTHPTWATSAHQSSAGPVSVHRVILTNAFKVQTRPHQLT